MKISWVHFSVSSHFAEGVLNKDHAVWLEGARPASAYILPSSAQNVLIQPKGIPTPKNTFASLKKFAKFVEITFL